MSYLVIVIKVWICCVGFSDIAQSVWDEVIGASLIVKFTALFWLPKMALCMILRISSQWQPLSFPEEKKNWVARFIFYSSSLHIWSFVECCLHHGPLKRFFTFCVSPPYSFSTHFVSNVLFLMFHGSKLSLSRSELYNNYINHVLVLDGSNN